MHFRGLPRNAPQWHKPLMDRQAHELTILSLVAVLGTMLASIREDETFMVVFAAQAAFAFASLVRRVGKRPRP
jgi:hypothetical protein